MQYLTQGVITVLGFGKAVGHLDVDGDVIGFLGAADSMLLPGHIVTLLPFLRKLIEMPLVRPLLPKPDDGSPVGKLLGFIRAQVDVQYGVNKTRNEDALQAFVDSGLDRTQVEAEALVLLFGGTDTTATALRNTTF